MSNNQDDERNPNDSGYDDTIVPERNDAPTDDSFSGNDSVLLSLSQTVGTFPKVVLRESSDAEPERIVRPSSPELPNRKSTGRYQLHGEIARGGMGAILKGRDTDLGRDLAIKVLLDSHKDRPEMIQRFIEEAQIGGQLQHPGIAPVYELGQFADKRPFFSMKLVKGETLSVLLSDRKDIAEERAKFLGIFEQICQTMAYAHSRGVIHRDLKPANVMVGAFGEVQVMDWGLAKVIPVGGVADEKKAHTIQNDKSIIQTMRSAGNETPAGLFGSAGSGGSETAMGSVLGTPAYMPPEQALGEIDRLDERSDVFGLGAILCEVLTGKPPYVASDGTQVFRLASRGKLDHCFERLEESGAGEELIAITKHCLELEPKDRPRDAGVLAERISTYLASVETRLREAQLEQASQSVRLIEERKRRRVTALLGAVAAAFLAVAGVGAVILQQNKAAIADANLQNQIATLQRDQEVANQAEKARQVVSNELAIGQSLLAECSGKEEPNEYMLRRLQEAAKRANDSLTDEMRETELPAQVTKLVDLAEQLSRTSKLVTELEEIRIHDMEQAMQQTWGTIYSSHGPPREINSSLGNSRMIEEAWADWGLSLRSSPSDASKRINLLPAWAIPSLIDSLYSWRQAIRLMSGRYETALNATWHLMDLVEPKSLGGALLTEQNDHSILADGFNPNRDTYELTFTTELQSFNALQIEALTHPSLPRNGPGRAVGGTGVISSLEIVCSSGEHDTKIAQAKIAAAESDYVHRGVGLKEEWWNLTGGEARSHRKIHFLETPLTVGRNAIVTIRIKGHTDENWGDQNLGCFRISVANIEADMGESSLQWLSKIIENVNVPKWTRSVWSAIDRQKTSDLLTLTEHADSEHAADIDVIRVVSEIQKSGEKSYLKHLRDNHTWKDVESKTITAKSNLIRETDGSFFVDGPPANQDTYQIDLPVGNERVTGVYFETQQDERLPQGGPGLGDVDQNCLIRKIRFYRMKAGKFEEKPITEVVSENRRVAGYSPENAIDNERGTYWEPSHPLGDAECATVFKISESASTELDSDIRIQVESGDPAAAYRKLLGKFRIRFTSDDLTATADPRTVATRLLHRVYASHPDSYRVLLAMAQLSATDASKDKSLSPSFAAAAIALRPANESSLSVFSTATLSRQPAPDDPWLQLLLRFTESRHDQMSQEVLTDVFEQQIERANSFQTADRVTAQQSYLAALKIDPTNFSSENHRSLGGTYTSTREFAKAEVHLRQSLVERPDWTWTWAYLGELRLNQNRTHDAVDCFRRSLLLEQDNAIAHTYFSSQLMLLQQFPEAIRAINAFEEHNSASYFTHLQRGLAFAETGELDASLQDLNKSIEMYPDYAPTYLELMCVSFLKNGKDDLGSVLARTNSRSTKLSTEVANEFRPSLFKPHRYVSPTVHDVQLKQKISIANAIRDPDNWFNWYINAIASLAAEDWESVQNAAVEMSDIDGRVGSIELTLMGAYWLGKCDYRTAAIFLLSASRHDINSVEPDRAYDFILSRQKLAGMLASHSDEQAFASAIEYLCSSPMRLPGDWYWNRIFAGWLLRADDTMVEQARDIIFPPVTAGSSKKSIKDDWLMAWIDARLTRSKEAVSVLEKQMEASGRDFIDMMFLAKAFADAGRPDDAARAVFESRLLFDLEWHPDQPNKHLQPEIRWAYGMALKQLEQLESILPKFEPERPELKYLLAAAEEDKKRAAAESPAPVPARTDVVMDVPKVETKSKQPADVLKDACEKDDWALASKTALSILETDPTDRFISLGAVSTLALADDEINYRNLCERMFDQAYDADPVSVSEMLFKASLLLPDFADLEHLSSFEFIAALDEGTAVKWFLPWGWATYGLLEHRRGNDSAALECVKKSQSHAPSDYAQAINLAVEAMATKRAGLATDHEAALVELEAVFVRLRATGKLSHHDYLYALALRREALANRVE